MFRSVKVTNQTKFFSPKIARPSLNRNQSQFSYKPPANLAEFTKQENYAKWHNYVKGSFDSSLHGGPRTLPLGTKWSRQIPNPQFYSEADTPTVNGAEREVPWNAFPKSVATKVGDINDQAYKMADQNVTIQDEGRNLLVRRYQDEYCEWFVTRNSGGKITKIEVTAEAPEYYEFLFNNDKELLLKLYQQYVSKQVKIEDLQYFSRDQNKYVYDAYNKWNTSQGIMHLNNFPNTLFAEIYLAASATVLRKKADGSIETDSQRLIECAQYGLETRNSDPNIGHVVNLLAQAGNRVTLKNPVALYIDNVDTSGIQNKDNSPLEPIDRYVKLLRGQEGMGLRYIFEVPNDGKDNFVVGDLKINGKKIDYGSQFAELFTIKLTGVACKAEHGVQPAVPCESARTKSLAHEMAPTNRRL